MTKRSANGTAFEWHGQRGAPVLVLIHGLGLTRDTWHGYIEELSQNYRLLTYDLFGHGESTQPPRKPDLSLYAQQLCELLDEVGVVTAVLVGFSLGGMINRRFAMDHPDRCDALVILNSPHERSAQAQQLVEQRAADTSAGGPAATLDATIDRWFTADFIRERQDVIQNIRGWVLANNPQTYAECRQVLAHGVIELIRPQPPVTVPTLVMTCEHDSGSTPAMTQAIAREISGAQSVIVPHLQHMGLVEQPQQFIQHLLPFLATLCEH
ncbi:MAG: alpha/beta hydrolase [Pseudomonadota bacterium]